MEIEKETMDIIQSELGELILHIDFGRRLDAKIGKLDRSAFRLLGELEQKGPMGISALADVFRLDNSTVSRQTAALVAKGLLKRVPEPKDGRISLLKITPLGRKQYEEVRLARIQLYKELLDEWSETDRNQLAEYLTRLNKSITERRKREASHS